MKTTTIHGKQLGLKYHYDLLKRIPREEMMAIISSQEICRDMPEMKFSINGSFRRENASSGDIDVLISGLKEKSRTANKFIEVLKKSGIIRDILASERNLWEYRVLMDIYS